MTLSLISATSVVALLSTAVGAAHAAVLAGAPPAGNIFDLVHDGMTSSSGGDATVTRQDPSVTAIAALEATSVDWRQLSFTGPVDTAQANAVFPRVPLGAAPGTRPDDDFATAITGAWHWNAWQRALAIGMERIAPLIGTVGNGPSANDRPGSTVFVAEGSAAGFNYSSATRAHSGSVAASSSTNTATVTLAGAANFRQRAGSGFAVAAPDTVVATAGHAEPAPASAAAADAMQPAAVYHYAPAPGPQSNPVAVAASFSHAVTANGVFARIAVPAASATAVARGLPATYASLIDLSDSPGTQATDTHVDGTSTFISASVSADPATTAAAYLANAVDRAPAAVTGQTVEAFQIGPAPDARTKGGEATSVADPLHGKVMASSGALNNSLALP